MNLLSRHCWLPAALVLLSTGGAAALDRAENPERSFFISIDLGTGLDLDRGARTPRDMWDRSPEAYSLGSFLLGFAAGFRFNEVVGIEGGWHEQIHDAHPEWGNAAAYQLGHLGLRLAWPSRLRQTPVLRLGPAIGSFSYGSASPGAAEDNDTMVAGGYAGLTVEHEVALGVVAALQLVYLPLWREGMDHEIFLSEYDLMTGELTYLDSKDFSKDRLVHLLWVCASIQFEWTMR